MKDMTHTEIIDVRLSAKPGASLGECMRDAVLLACQEWQNVTLIHNGKDYRVLCNDLLGCVEEMQEDL